MRISSIVAAVSILGLAAGGALAEGSSSPSSPSASQQNAQFCLQSSGGQKNCTYATMAACNAAKKSASDSCVQNTATTGSGSTSSPNNMKK